MLRKLVLMANALMLCGCWSTYIEPNNPNVAKIEIINDSNEMNVVLATFEDGVSCKGIQFFNIPKNMQYARANMDSQLKAGGVFYTSINVEKAFTLEFDGRAPRSYGADQCQITTTLMPYKNESYEYHYDYSQASNRCKVYLYSIVGDKRTLLETPRFVSRERQSSLNSEGSCKKL